MKSIDCINFEDENEINANEIVCPYCRHVFDDCEDKMGFVTYWGEEGPQDYDCSACDKIFKVEENVSRTYTMTTKVQKEISK